MVTADHLRRFLRFDLDGFLRGTALVRAPLRPLETVVFRLPRLDFLVVRRFPAAADRVGFFLENFLRRTTRLLPLVPRSAACFSERISSNVKRR